MDHKYGHGLAVASQESLVSVNSGTVTQPWLYLLSSLNLYTTKLFPHPARQNQAGSNQAHIMTHLIVIFQSSPALHLEINKFRIITRITA